MKRRVALAVVLAALAAGPRASADDRSSAAAQALFEEGRALMGRGQIHEACSRFEQSQHLDPGAGTLMNLADCYERDGKLASAWLAYTDALAAADKTGRASWSSRARDKANALRPRLATLTIVVSNDTPTVSRDGVKVPESELGVSVPVDAGRHVIAAEAPGKKPWRTEVTIAPTPSDTRVVIPALSLEPSRPSSPAAPPRRESGALRTAGIVMIGGGIAGVAAGTVFGLVARGKRDDALGTCIADGAFCDAAGITNMNEAHTWATVSTVSFIAGGVLAAAGLITFLVAPRAPAGSARADVFRVRF